VAPPGAKTAQNDFVIDNRQLRDSSGEAVPLLIPLTIETA
jgi:hypothetical protein